MFVLGQDDVVRFLYAYGWLKTDDPSPKQLEAATKSYQRFHKLVPDGVVGSATSRSLLEPRFCAAPDRLKLGRQPVKWPTFEVTYWIESPLPGLSMSETWEAFDDGCGEWNKVTQLRMKRAGSKSSAMIQAAVGPIDSSGGTLAWSTLGRGNPCKQKYDSRDQWGEGGIVARAVICHEVGHALDLEHSSRGGQLMSPTYSRNILVPQSEDIKRIQALYGQPPAPPSPPETPPGGPPTISVSLTIPPDCVPGAYVAEGKMRPGSKLVVKCAR